MPEHSQNKRPHRVEAKLSGQVAEWLKAVARKGCYTTQVVSEVRILPLSAKISPDRKGLRFLNG